MQINQVYKIDAVEGLKLLESNSIDLIVSDPPYKITAWWCSPTSMQGILSQNWNKIFKYNDIHISDYIFELYRVLKEDSHLYLMVNTLNLHDFLKWIKKAKFKIHNLLVWKKNNLITSKRYMKNCEYIILAYKWKAKNINFCSSQTVHEFKNPITTRKHPTQKPIKMMELYIKNSSKIWDLILDPFVGSWSTLLASQNLERNFIWFEIDKQYFTLAKTSLEKNHLKIEVKNKTIKTFIRKKTINWKVYYYEVHNYRDKETWKIRQKVVKYLGKELKTN